MSPADVLRALAADNRLSVAVAALVVAAAVIAVSASDSTASIQLRPSVDIRFGDGRIDVSVTLPGPQYYSYYTYYTYYTYYYYYSTVQGTIPVKVIVAAEKLYNATGAPQLVRLAVLPLEAYGNNNAGSVSFTGLEPGSYRVKVMFWNQLLSVLRGSGGSWESYADPVIREGSVG